MSKWWRTFKKDPIEAIITAIDELGRALEEIGQRLARRRSGRGRVAPFQSFRDAPFAPEMVVLPAGSFLMGSPSDPLVEENERPQRDVTVASFAIGRYPVTFAEYDHFCDVTGRRKPDDHGWGRRRMPVIEVSWNDAVAYAAWLSERTGKRYRLPSETEWEYACRAGTSTAYWWGNDFLPKMANVKGQTQTTEVGSFPSNPWGLDDTLGNVWEWVDDHWHDNYEGAPSDRRAWVDAEVQDDRPRVLRGGSWVVSRGSARCASRGLRGPGGRGNGVGFRVVCSSPS